MTVKQKETAMKKLSAITCLLALLILALPVGAKAASPTLSIDTSNKQEIYKNTFDDEASIKDFIQYNGKWGVRDGRARLISYSSSTNTFMIYSGKKELTELTDYVVEVDLYNVQTAAGLVARCDLDNAQSTIHGYAGYNLFTSSEGRKTAIRSASSDGRSAPLLKVSNWRINPGDDLHFEAAFSNNIVQLTVTDIATKKVLWGWSGRNSDYPSGSFGIMAYTKLFNGYLDCRKSSFDDLTVSTLSNPPSKSFTAVSGAISSDGKGRIDTTKNSTVAIAQRTEIQKGSVGVTTYLPSSGNAGVVFCRSDDGSYYKFGISNDKKLHLIKVAGGRQTTLKTTSLSAMGAGSWGACTLRAVFDGKSIYCYINDMCLLSFTDASPLSGKGAGIFADALNSTFLHFSVSDVSTPDKADIVIWGHSHMQGWYDASDDLAPYGKVANLGVGGSNTPYWSKLTNEISSYSADTIIVMTGSNDLKSYSNSQTLTTLKTTFNALRKSNPNIHIILITEWYQPARIEQYADKVRDLNAKYKDYADSNKEWLTIVDGFGIPMNEKGEFSDALFTDTQHFGILGYTELTKRALTALENIKNGIYTGGDPTSAPPAEDTSEGTSEITDTPADTAAQTQAYTDTQKQDSDTVTIITVSVSAAVIAVSAAVIAVILTKKNKQS